MADSETTRLWITEGNAQKKKKELGQAIRDNLQAGCTVTVSPKRESRRDIQNRLAQVWCGQYAKAKGYDKKFCWGLWKLEFLLPIKLTDERMAEVGERENLIIEAGVQAMRELPDHDPADDYENKVMAAETVIRSKEGIAVRPFAMWLTDIQNHAANEGIELRSNRDDTLYALMMDREAA